MLTYVVLTWLTVGVLFGWYMFVFETAAGHRSLRDFVISTVGGAAMGTGLLVAIVLVGLLSIGEDA